MEGIIHARRGFETCDSRILYLQFKFPNGTRQIASTPRVMPRLLPNWSFRPTRFVVRMKNPNLNNLRVKSSTFVGELPHIFYTGWLFNN